MTISYWQAQAGLPQTAIPPAPATMEADLCIIGAGIIGAGAAYWAKQRGLAAVLVDGRDAALGASGRNAGFVLTGVAGSYAAAVRDYGRARARQLWQLSLDNVALMLELSERFGIATERKGSILLAESEAEAEELYQSAGLLQEDGFPGDFTPYDPLNRGFYASLARPGDGTTQPALLTRALIASTGYPLITHAPVTRFYEQGDQVVVETERTLIHAKQVLIATNAYSAQLHPYFTDKVSPMRGQIYISDPVPQIFDTAGYSHYGYFYFRQVPEVDMPGQGRWLLGGARHLHYGTENHNLSEDLHPPLQADLEAWTAQHFPEFADVPIQCRWAGTMGFTEDGLPLVGRLPGYDRVAFSVGFNGHGMGLGIMVVKEAIELLCEDAPSHLFDVNRAMFATHYP